MAAAVVVHLLLVYNPGAFITMGGTKAAILRCKPLNPLFKSVAFRQVLYRVEGHKLLPLLRVPGFHERII